MAARLVASLSGRDLTAAGLRTELFAPPRWFASAATVEALREQGFGALADDVGVRFLHGPTAGTVVRARVLGFRVPPQLRAEHRTAPRRSPGGGEGPAAARAARRGAGRRRRGAGTGRRPVTYRPTAVAQAAGAPPGRLALTFDRIRAARENPAVSPEVLCIGESMILVTPVEPTPLETAEQFALHVGGAESTVALYLAERGHRAAWLSQVGDDPLGRRMLAAVGRHGVDTSLVRVDPGAPTGVYFKDPGPEATRVYYYRAGSAASRMSGANLDGIDWSDTRVVHVSGITAGLSTSCRELLTTAHTAARRHGALVSFDVNYRPGVWSVAEAAPVLLDLARHADVVFIGRDEAERLWGMGEPGAVAELIDAPVRLVVKDGPVGATEVAPDAEPVFVPARRVEVVEVVGAGDAFAAGYLSELLHGSAPAARLDAGHDLAARSLSSTHDYLPQL
jgi:2-dehydro-3-deoxygluconokinase